MQAPIGLSLSKPVHSKMTATQHDSKKCEADLHRIFETSKFEIGDYKVSTEVANSTKSVYLDSIKKYSTQYHICCCKVVNVWLGGMNKPFRTSYNLQLFLMTRNVKEPEILLGDFKTEEELSVTCRVLYCCSTAFLSNRNVPSESAGVRSIEVPNPPSNNVLPPAIEVTNPPASNFLPLTIEVPNPPSNDFLPPAIEVPNPPSNNFLSPAIEVPNPPSNNFLPPAISVPKRGKFFQCCALLECDKKDLESYAAVKCENCEEVIHTRCALVLKHLRLDTHHEIGDIACYECGCGFKNWKIIGDILYRVKALVEDIGKVQIPQKGKRKRIDVQNARSEVVCKLKEVVDNLFKIVRTTKPRGFLSVSGKNPIMLITFTNVLKMVNDMKKDMNQVDYGPWITMIDDTLHTIEM